jgi:uncharacterized protein (TIGR00369 family)
MGLTVLSANSDQVVGEWVVGPEHHQPYGIVHGGVFSGLIETLCSVGAALDAMPRGQSVVGLENHTSFLRAVRQGKLTCTATPVQRGRRAQLWEGAVRDEQGRLVASGRVRLMCLEPGAALAGEKVAVKPT